MTDTDKLIAAYANWVASAKQNPMFKGAVYWVARLSTALRALSADLARERELVDSCGETIVLQMSRISQLEEDLAAAKLAEVLG